MGARSWMPSRPAFAFPHLVFLNEFFFLRSRVSVSRSFVEGVVGVRPMGGGGGVSISRELFSSERRYFNIFCHFFKPLDLDPDSESGSIRPPKSGSGSETLVNPVSPSLYGGESSEHCVLSSLHRNAKLAFLFFCVLRSCIQICVPTCPRS